MRVELRGKMSNYNIIIYSCYLPPEGSPYADTTLFYSHLTTEIYKGYSSDLLLICGDFNSRIGLENDFISCIDNVQVRKPLDLIKNSYCDSFLEFLKDNKLCILNGRITPHMDNFTCINSRGCSVVDYFIVPQQHVQMCESCSVYCANDLINSLGIHDLLSSSCRALDHSIICGKFVSRYQYEHNDLSADKNNINDGLNVMPNRKIYDYRNISPCFMNSESWNEKITDLIIKLETQINVNNKLDSIYDNLITVITNEMDKYINFKCIPKQLKKKMRNSKPY